MSCTNSLSAEECQSAEPFAQWGWVVLALTVDAAVAVLVGFTDHLIYLVVGELLADRGHDVTELGRRNKAVVVTIEDLYEWLAGTPR